MGQFIDLTAKDGFTFPAYVAEPAGKPKGAVVVVQEIFGVNSHIRSVADGYAAEGYLAVAPATFHRVKQGVELGYSEDDMKNGFGLKTAVEALPAPGVLQDLQAAVDYASKAGKVGIVGYCWGGLLTWRAAAEVSGLSAAVPYYGGGIQNHLQEAASINVPVQFHYGALDAHIPPEAVTSVRTAMTGKRGSEVFVYEGADHGFNCWARASYHQRSAALAHGRALAFLAEAL